MAGETLWPFCGLPLSEAQRPMTQDVHKHKRQQHESFQMRCCSLLLISLESVKVKVRFCFQLSFQLNSFFPERLHFLGRFPSPVFPHPVLALAIVSINSMEIPFRDCELHEGRDIVSCFFFLHGSSPSSCIKQVIKNYTLDKCMSKFTCFITFNLYDFYYLSFNRCEN